MIAYSPGLICRRLLAAVCLAAVASAPAFATKPVLKYKSQITVKVSPQKAWDSFKTFGKIHDWHPATENCKLLVGENGKPLAVREFQLKGGGGFVISELLAYDESRKRFKYRIIKTNLPLANYVAEMWVTSASAGGSVVHWRANFQRPGETPQPGQGDEDTHSAVEDVPPAQRPLLANQSRSSCAAECRRPLHCRQPPRPVQCRPRAQSHAATQAPVINPPRFSAD